MLVSLKPVLYYCIFDRMVLKTVLQGLMWQIYLFMQKEVFFFLRKKKEVWLIMHSSSRALKLHGLIKVDAKWERNKKTKTNKKKTKNKKNQQNVYQKTQTNEQCLSNFTVSVEFSCKYVSNDIFLGKKNLYNVVECEGQLSPRHRRLKAASAGVVIGRFICASVTENFEHPGTRYPHLNDISLRTTFVGLCVSLDTFSTTVGDE